MSSLILLVIEIFLQNSFISSHHIKESWGYIYSNFLNDDKIYFMVINITNSKNFNVKVLQGQSLGLIIFNKC